MCIRDRAMFVYLKIRNEVLPGKAGAFFVLKNGKRMYPGKVYLLVKRNLSTVVSLKKRSPHVLRHTFATAMLNLSLIHIFCRVRRGYKCF